ncbi:uncharacterized protein LOC119079108 [Bradysia coprophila]|uniref:uncharacterized protein LOC119079108 n=1 Tax=Bradysia coprophila TaxID=38358 RepID=UPI00187DC0AF|nr:uncharacterized protein LOC119079108 [Bradysia coprophila]
MKAIQSVIFVTLCLSFGSCDIPGRLVRVSRITSRVAEPSCLNLVTPICKDCNTLLRCLMVDPAPEVPCKTQYPDRPFCHNGACVAEAQGDCVVSTTFTCTGAGYYPDPLNCSRYHLCGANGATDPDYSFYECPVGFVYNPATTMCKLSTSASDCAVADCSADPTGYAVYPADNNIFFYCSADEEPKVLKCPVNNVFDPASFSCVFQCSREGRIADPSDKKKFFECYKNGATYITLSLSCVDSFEFDAKLEQCVKSAVPAPPLAPTVP